MLATFNVNSLKSRLQIVQTWLQQHNPDFLLLQEIKGEDEAIFNNFSAIGYNSYYHLQKTYNGVAILSKHNCTVLHKNMPNYTDTQARLITVLHNNTAIVNVYMPNGNPILAEDGSKNNPKFLYKLQWQQHFFNYIKSLLQQYKKVVIGGDFNIIPTSADCYNTKPFLNDALFQIQVQDWYYNLLNLGFTDTLNYYNLQNTQNFTWWDYRGGSLAKNLGVRIDHILVSNYMVHQTSGCVVDKNPRLLDKPSDHTPVLCSLTF